VLDAQCVHFHGADSDITVDAARSLFSLDSWSADARILILAMDDELDAARIDDDEIAALTYQFTLSIDVVRHLQLDPLLPAALIPRDWPAATLRSAYRRFDDSFKRHMGHAFRAAG
jgi:phenylacetic acid degradation operon negative regulatory protein